MLALEINRLYKTYANGHQALKGIDLVVEDGDFFALLGPNGAGKSTTIGIISHLVNLDSGSVNIYGHSIADESELAKSYLGIVPQEFNFNPFEKVIDIVTNQAGYYGIPKRIAQPNIEKYLKQLGLFDKQQSIARELSGGMKRRLMIARALIHEPKLLILDEPTAGVDIELRRDMWQFLADINQQGTTIILTTHYLEEAENLCRHIAIINHGEIIQQGKMSELLKQLDVQTLILYLKEPLDNWQPLAAYHAKSIDPTTIEIDLIAENGLNSLFQLLDKLKVTVTSIKNKVNRLEEIFLRLTRQTNPTATIQSSKS